MNTIEIKANIHELVEKTFDEDVLKKVKYLLDNPYLSEEVDWHELSDELKLQIEEGLKDAEEGRTIPHEVVKAKFRAKYASFYGS